MQQHPTRNPGIDLLRGLSIVLVIMLHLAIRIPLTHTAISAIAPAWLLNALCFNGAESVCVFFVISGFLIAGNCLRRWEDIGRPHIRAFYVRRAARILPCLVLVVALLSILDLLGCSGYVIARSDQSLPRAIIAALGFHLNLYEAYTGYLPAAWTVLWSLSIEEVFYLGFPVACLLARRSAWPLVVPLILLAASLPETRKLNAANEILREQAYLYGMAAIATGVLAALAAHRWRLRRPLYLGLVSIGSLAWLAIIFVEDSIWGYLGEYTLLILTIGTAVLLIGLDGLQWRLPGTDWLQSFGRLSYEIYLTHVFVMLTAFALFHEAALPDRLGYILYPPVLVLSLLVGWIVSRLISQPAEQWIKHRWLRREITRLDCAGT
jgi:peptidoglycan/LPS O-acetylase OafA/YrhL